MIFNFTQPIFLAKDSFVQNFGYKNSPNGVVKRKKRKFSTSIKIFCMLVVTVVGAKSGAAQLNLYFGVNNTKVIGTDKAKGAKYLYTSVNDTLDCIVTIADIQGGAVVYSVDDNGGNNGGSIGRFQPIITVAQNNYNTSYVKFNFQLIKKGSYTSSNGGSGINVIPSDPVWFRAYDIDGDGVNNGTQEFVEVSSIFTGAWVDASTQLVGRANVMGGTAYTISNSNINGTKISDDGSRAFNGFIYSNTVSSWDIVGGAYVGSNIPDPNKGIDAGDRLNSWSFNYTEVVPGVDFGDAPASYNVPVGAAAGATIIPAYNLVPSIASNVKVYLGSVKPDLDYDPSGNVNASVDDNNNAIDDEDGFRSTYFPKYTTGSSTYSCIITATNTSSADASLYGFIDFNGDGKFDPTKEVSTKVTVPKNSGTQTYTVTFSGGFVFNASSNSRYVRFRIGSVDAEAAAPTGKAVDGEVEDYRFNTALKISGTVYNDNNGTTDNLINNVKGTVNGYLNNTAATPLFAVLLDSTGKVLQSVLIPSNGLYSLDSAGTNGKFTVLISTNNPVFGTTPTITALTTLPTGYVFTSEGVTSTTPAGDKLGTGSFLAQTVIDEIKKMDFGWDALPETDTKGTTINSPNTGTKYALFSTPLTGSDLEDSKVASSISTGGSFVFKTIPVGATLYYLGNAITAGQKITSYDPTKLFVQFTTAGNKSFTYQTVDAADKRDTSAATYTITSNNVLPLNDIVLSANLQNGVVKLTLVAKNENQVARYTWEQSTNGTIFTTIGSAAYQATNASSNMYNFSTVPTGTLNTVYFRTVQYSSDGTTLTSNTVAVKLNETGAAQAIALPTVIKDITNIKISSAITQTINLNIVDNAGRMVMRKQATLSAGSNTFAIDGFDKLSNGSYYLQIIGMDNQSVIKIIVQH